jgi:hypothetical protein
VVARAKELLVTLEGEHRVAPGTPPVKDPSQADLFGNSPRYPLSAGPDQVRDELRALDLDALTPLDALNRLAALKKKAGENT